MFLTGEIGFTRFSAQKATETRELLGNIPVFKGTKSYLSEALQRLSGALAFFF